MASFQQIEERSLGVRVRQRKDDWSLGSAHEKNPIREMADEDVRGGVATIMAVVLSRRDGVDVVNGLVGQGPSSVALRQVKAFRQARHLHGRAKANEARSSQEDNGRPLCNPKVSLPHGVGCKERTEQCPSEVMRHEEDEG